MAYSGVYVFGDSLVDAGNALRLAEDVDTVASMPDGAPTAEDGYYKGRFSDGYTFADLVANKFIGVVTKPVYPFGFYPFLSDPSGNNLNFAYGGAQIRKGSETVPDLDDQTDAFRDAVDGDTDGNALHFLTIGGNDVRELVPRSGDYVTDLAYAHLMLTKAANELHEEVAGLIDIGARHVVVTGIPDVGIIPNYNDTVDEAGRRQAASDYSEFLDGLIQTRLQQLRDSYGGAVTINYVSLVDATNAGVANLNAAGFNVGPLEDSTLLFFDSIHPTARSHALLAAAILDGMNVQNGRLAAGENVPLTTVDYRLGSTIAAVGEIDRVTISLSAGASYRFEMSGTSYLGTMTPDGVRTFADPMLRLVAPGATASWSDDDGGLGLDAVLILRAETTGDHVIELSGVGGLSGAYRFQAEGSAPGDDLYLISNSDSLILERAGEGWDAARTSVSYTLGIGVSIEVLETSATNSTAALRLTGNEFDQTIIGNAGANVIDGKGSVDQLLGGSGKDSFAFTSALVRGQLFDTIHDYNVRDDTILLDDLIFGGVAGALPKGAFALGASARQSDDRIIYDPANGALYFDPDGSGPLEQIHFALISPGLKMTAADFTII